ncbi:MAG TPA: hypothetical protein VM425_11430 [Myxococcota bacterium]|nr:hypothetical protein [Myxococcota bacterium]
MLRTALTAMACVAALSTLSCGDDCGGICGSECELVDCHYTTIKCDLYPPPTPGIVIHYVIDNEGGGQNWVARIFIDTDGLAQVEGSHFESQDFLDRIQLTRPGGGEQWPDFDGNDCKISSGGDEAGKGMSGQCNFKFLNGYFATFNFSCELMAVE